MSKGITLFYFKSFTPIIMETNIIERNLRQFHGTEEYHKHLFPGKSPLLLTDGCKYIRDDLQAFWLFDAILIYQMHKSLRDVNFQIWG
jgi:hypothetical protein